jgi:type VI secretion system protein ImpA
MVTPETFDLESLLAPISDENPVGEDPRLDSSPTSTYYQIKDTRNQARAAERQLLMAGEGEPADWSPLLELVPAALSVLAKDLELTTYYIEALCREYGIAGLRDGFRLARELVDRFGDDIYPTPDEDGIETRLAPLTSLNGEGGDGTLIAPIRMIPLTQPTDAGEFSLADYQQSQNLDRLSGEARERQIDQGVATLTEISSAVAQTGVSFYQNLTEDLEEALSELQSLTETLDSRYGHEAPPTGSIQKVLEEIQSTLQSLVGDRLATEQPAEDAFMEEEDEGEGLPGEGPAAKPAVAAGTIQTREDAFRQILRVAEFFRKTEPHTPISFALERIVRWGRMPLPQLLRELIGDEGSVHEMFKLVGIPDISEDEEQDESYE